MRLGNSPTFPLDPPVAAGEVGRDASGRLAYHDGVKAWQLGPRTPQFTELMTFGNSYAQLNTAGASRIGHRWSVRLAGMLGARDVNYGINGSRIIWPDSGPNGGWNTVFQTLLRNREIGRAAGSGYPNESSLGVLYYGGNDFPRLGFSKLTTTGPYGNALRSSIARYRASRNIASNHSSVVYATPANWTSQSSILLGANPAGTGETVKQTSTATPGTITITTPTDVEAGCYITVYFPVDPASTAGTAAITWNGVSQGSLTIGGNTLFDNSADTSGAALVTANRHCVTCKRIGPVVTPGAQTIVITMTGVAGPCSFGGYTIEEANPGLLLIPNFPKIPAAAGGYGLWRLAGGQGYQGTTSQLPASDTGVNSVDTLWDQGNSVTQQVAAEFDARVLYIDVDGALAKNPIYWPANDQHPNDRGNAVIAGLMYDAVERVVQNYVGTDLAYAAVDTVGGDSPSDQYATSPGAYGQANASGRSRSAKLYIPVYVGDSPLSKTLVANTELQLNGGQRYMSVSDYTDFRLVAQVTTALANARMYLTPQPVFGWVGMDGVTLTHPEYGALTLAATGLWVSAWMPIHPSLRRGDFQIKANLYGSTAGTVAFNNAGYEFR